MFLNKKSICITLVMVIFACVCISAVSANTNITSDNSQDNVTDLENNSIDLVKESERNLTIWDICVPYESDSLAIGPADFYDLVKQICSEKRNI